MACSLGAAEAAKKHPSDHPYVWIEEEYLAEVGATQVHLSLELARDKYEQMITPFVEETLQAIPNAARAADLTASQADEILFVSGATCSPMIRRTCSKSLAGSHWRGGCRTVCGDRCCNPGSGDRGVGVSAVPVDVTPYTCCARALDAFDSELYPYRYVPVVARSTPIPVRKSEAFYTVMVDQTEVDVRIYQGENEDALENIKIGQFMIEGLSKAQVGNPLLFGPVGTLLFLVESGPRPR
jgi:molecular chaperone DnaK